MSRHPPRNDWAAIFAVLKVCACILGLLAAFIGLSGCIIAPYGDDRGGGYYYPQHEHYRGGYWGGQGRGY
jgi:hypothetical protein